VVTAEIPLPAKSGPAAAAKKRKAGVWPPRSRGYKVFKIVNAIILIGVVLAVLLPFVNLLAQSFSGETYINQGSVSLWPKGFNVTTYQHVMSDPQFWENYRNTVLYTVASTAVAMVLTVCYAYVLSRRNLRGRKLLTWIAIVTMFFNGGTTSWSAACTCGTRSGRTRCPTRSSCSTC
jgi:putative aldouronate transport system permease protein